MKIYLVEGSQGEYDDRYQWIASAHIHEHEAVAKANMLNTWCKEHPNVKYHEFDKEFGAYYIAGTTDYNVVGTIELECTKEAFLDMAIKQNE